MRRVSCRDPPHKLPQIALPHLTQCTSYVLTLYYRFRCIVEHTFEMKRRSDENLRQRNDDNATNDNDDDDDDGDDDNDDNDDNDDDDDHHHHHKYRRGTFTHQEEMMAIHKK